MMDRAHSSRKALWVATVLAVVALPASTMSMSSTGASLLFAMEFAGGNPDLYVLDPTTGAPLSFAVVGHVASVRGLTYWNGRLLAVDDVQPFHAATHLIAINPADAKKATVGYIGMTVDHHASLDGDQTTDVLYGLLDYELYSVDPVSGHVSFIAPLTGGVGGYTALAIDAQGNAYVTGAGGRLYSLDLHNGQVVFLKNFGFGVGEFFDLTFAPDGMLWGSYLDYAVSQSKSGVYKIDLTALTATMVAWKKNPYLGVAFGPAPRVASYCTPKQSSIGCTPTIDYQGIPSATGKFGFVVKADQVENQQIGKLLYSVGGPAQLPFARGTLCLRPPIASTPLTNSGGSPPGVRDCSGSLGVDFNYFANLGAGPPELDRPGTEVWCQWLARDPDYAYPNNLSLSDALHFVLEP